MPPRTGDLNPRPTVWTSAWCCSMGQTWYRAVIGCCRRRLLDIRPCNQGIGLRG